MSFDTMENLLFFLPLLLPLPLPLPLHLFEEELACNVMLLAELIDA
jgi:hypothetical protein